MRITMLAAVLAVLVLAVPSAGAGNKRTQARVAPENPESAMSAVWEGMRYRPIGPYRGGRSAAVTGVPGKPTTFYFGSTGGGVWRTIDGGNRWENISDGAFGGSIGAVAVSAWDPNVIYAGGGEKTVRGNVSSGAGIWRSLDDGKNWTHQGLAETRHIARLRIHPRNPDLVYAAAMGNLYQSDKSRGIYRTKDGGDTWEQVLFVNPDAGAVDLCMDPGNPRILYASFWRVRRTPYSLESGGLGSGLWKSTDGGDTWTELTGAKGLPEGIWGINGITVSPLDGDRLWAIVEAPEGGVFRSDDAGKTWTRINEDRALRQRAWYYSRIYADTADKNTVYVLNVRFWKSVDGGKTFKSIGTPHGDHHDLWIDPADAQRMIIGDDGGAQVSYDGGAHWSTYHNQPTAQFYRVATDTHFPYRILAAQQDNSTVRIAHRGEGRTLDTRDWEPTAGGESGHVVADPRDPDIVYGGSYGGYLTRRNHRTGAERNIHVWPDNPMGHGAADLTYRFQWNFPIFFSPHDPNVLYAAGNVLFRTTDAGQTWQAVSGDLTTNDKSKQGPSGGPITKDNTSVEYYCTIFAAAESPVTAGVLWTGSDDGLVHVSRNNGADWTDVTPKNLPAWTQINSIEPHPTLPGGLYLAGTRYKLGDNTPYLFKTTDYGAHWTRITEGIDPHHFTRVVRADPHHAGLLYAGTEQGMYLSFNDGATWQPFQLNLPIVPITDLALKDDDLIVATQGRSLWVLDDVTPLHHMPTATPDKALLFPPRPSWRLSARVDDKPTDAGRNLPGGVLVHFYLPEDPSPPKPAAKEDDQATETDKPAAPEPEPLTLAFFDAQGREIRRFVQGLSDEEVKKGDAGKLEAVKGFNQFAWDMRQADAASFDGMVVWSGNMRGPVVPPGRYEVRLGRGEQIQTAAFDLRADPRSEADDAELADQYRFLMDVRDKLTETHRALKRIAKVRSQLKALTEPLKDLEEYAAIRTAAEGLTKKLEAVETTLYQTKNKSPQDPLNFPIRLNDRLAGVKDAAETGDYPPTEAAVKVKDLLFAEIDAALTDLDRMMTEDVPAFNTLVHEASVPAVWVED